MKNICFILATLILCTNEFKGQSEKECYLFFLANTSLFQPLKLRHTPFDVVGFGKESISYKPTVGIGLGVGIKFKKFSLLINETFASLISNNTYKLYDYNDNFEFYNTKSKEQFLKTGIQFYYELIDFQIKSKLYYLELGGGVNFYYTFPRLGNFSEFERSDINFPITKYQVEYYNSKSLIEPNLDFFIYHKLKIFDIGIGLSYTRYFSSYVTDFYSKSNYIYSVFENNSLNKVIYYTISLKYIKQ